ncbi:MAG TPA: glycosyltransferase [Polyangia bacterium]|jgi:glycosyltransferase involved in cell wall biosynthesis
MRTVLMIAFLFPPRASIGGKRPLRFARHLPAHGWRPVVLAGPPGTAEENDDSLLAALPADLQVSRDYAPPWIWAVRNFGEGLDQRLRPKTQARNRTGTGPAPAGGKLAGLVEGLGDRLVPLDGNIAFVPYACRTAERLVRETRPDAVYVSSYPYSALLVGLTLKLHLGLPFIAELRDPWTLNVQFAARHPAVKALERRLERLVFEAADAVVVTTDAVREAYERLYPDLPADRVRRIYSSYDEGLAPAAPAAPPAGPLTAVHFGSFYGPRRALPLLRAMARLRDERGLAARDLRLLVFGRLDAAEDHQAARDLGLEESLVVRERVPYAEGIAALRQADLLYLPAFGEETFYIPGKMYDYFLAGRPILCETASREMTRMLAETGTGVAVPVGDVAGMARCLARALDARAGGPAVAAPDRAAIERFSAPAITGELAALLDEIAG